MPELRIIARPGLGHRGANPYTWLLYSHLESRGGVKVEEYGWRRILRRRYDVWHLHWPEGHLNDRSAAVALRRTASELSWIRWARSRGTRIVWTVHNLRAHEGYHPALEAVFWRDFIGHLDGHISLSRASQAQALARFPRLAEVPGFVIPHGHYRTSYPAPLERAEARRALGLDPMATVVALVGYVRAYKNVPRLIHAFRALSDRSLVLLIAGESKSPELSAQIREAAEGDPRIRLDLRFLDEERVHRYLSAADLVALPYREVLNSGSAILALSLDRPVLAPDAASIVELQETVSPAWLRTYSGELNAERLGTALEWVRQTSRPGPAPLESLDWDRIAAATLAAYRQVLALR
jgi:glycosyltransferase involved in cell wall biosynthesis